MKRLGSLLITIIAGGWMGAVPALASGQPMGVVTSVIPVAYIVGEVGGERVEVDPLIPPGASPHTFEPVPSDLRKVSRARLFVVVGGGFDAWSDKLRGAASHALETLALMEVPGLKPLEGEDHHHGEEHGEEKAAARENEDHGEHKAAARQEEHHGHEQEHHGHEHAVRGGSEKEGEEEHEALDPHFWLDPIRVRDSVVPVVVEHLIAADPEGKGYYRRRGDDFRNRLTALDEQIRRELDKAKSRKYIAFHDAWSYFGERYDLEKVAVVQEFAGEEPTPGEVANLVSSARAARVEAILVEPQLSPRVAQTIAGEFGGETVLVDPLGDPGDPARSTYERLMLYNARAFGRALQGKQN